MEKFKKYIGYVQEVKGLGTQCSLKSIIRTLPCETRHTRQTKLKELIHILTKFLKILLTQYLKKENR